VRVSDAAGGELASGQVSGVDESGRLVVETAKGPIAISSGDVTLA
jgi:biotin-(acetyl-CoA carboxylase) ligase